MQDVQPDVKTLEQRKKQKAEYENVIINNDHTKTIEIVTKEKHDLAFDSETHAFVEMLTKLRSRFKHDDPKTNTGLVINPVIKTSTYAKNTEIKLVVRFDRCLTQDNVVTFTCDVSSSIYVIISKVLFATDQNDADSNDYVLQVSGVNEYLGMYVLEIVLFLVKSISRKNFVKMISRKNGPNT